MVELHATWREQRREGEVAMDSEPAGEYIALVVRVQPDADGSWSIHVEGAAQPLVIPLVPATLVVRLWRIGGTGVLRGRVRLDGDDSWAPIQSNTRLEELVRAWLLSDTE